MHTKIVNKNSDEFIINYNSDLSGDVILTFDAKYFEPGAETSSVTIPGMLIQEVVDEVVECKMEDVDAEANKHKNINIFRTLVDLPYKASCFSAATYAYCGSLTALGLEFSHTNFMRKMDEVITTLSSSCQKFDANINTIPEDVSELQDLGTERVRLASIIVSSIMNISFTLIGLRDFENSLSGNVLRYNRGMRKELLKHAANIFKYVIDNDNIEEAILRVFADYGRMCIMKAIAEDT